MNVAGIGRPNVDWIHTDSVNGAAMRVTWDSEVSWRSLLRLAEQFEKCFSYVSLWWNH